MINIRLYFASLWIPKKLQIKELQKIRIKTNQALDRLLEQNYKSFQKKQLTKNMKLEELRKKMTEEHNTKIAKLITKFGQEKSIKEARKELFKVGIELGQKARRKLRIKNSISDFFKAAKIMYKILGIKFQTKQLNKNEIVMYVNRCSLSKYYNDKTCQALSATDEGVVRGLNPNFKMAFQERITSGSLRCMAQIIIRENG